MEGEGIPGYVMRRLIMSCMVGVVLFAQTAVKVDVTSLRSSSRRRQDKAVVVVISGATLSRDVVQMSVQRIGMDVKQAAMMVLVCDIVVKNGTTQGYCSNLHDITISVIYLEFLTN
jgi:5-deoxy-D-glucuronate isomerase